MKAEFEEKQYEQHLNVELLRGSNMFFPPGQVLEHTLGFDVALLTGHPSFWVNFSDIYRWRHRRLKHGPGGIKLPTMIWEDMLDTIDHLPPFKFNAFIQHKRPEYLNRSNAAEWESWNNPYYRYDTVPHQQDALSKLEKAIGKKGVVVYACGAFHTAVEFWERIRTSSVVQHSNFCQPKLLEGHNRFTFKAPGSSGVAHSEPEEVQSYDLLQRIEELRALEPAENNRDYLKILGQEVEAALKDNKHYIESI
jgi:hypothetical protein